MKKQRKGDKKKTEENINEKLKQKYTMQSQFILTMPRDSNLYQVSPAPLATHIVHTSHHFMLDKAN